MNILKITNSRLKEHYFKVENKFNLPILLYPTPQFSSTGAAFATNFGSATAFFKKTDDSEFNEIVDGTAHYLEHKLFKDDGEDNTFKLFAKTGAMANAQTSRNSTSYFFYCTQNFEASLKILLDFVQNPCFSEQSVQKERGIIDQEIQMLEGNPLEKTFSNCLAALFQNCPAGKKIGGTTESINRISVDSLKKCYDAFYRLDNMAILIAGNFNLNSTLEIIEQNLKVPTSNSKVELMQIDEPTEVSQNFVKCEMTIMLPYFCFGYKLIPPSDNLILKKKLIFETICEMLTGEGSALQKILYEKNLVAGGTISYTIEAGKGYFAVVFAGLSTNYNEVFKLINAEIERVQNFGFDEALFNLIKKASFGEQIANFNSVESLQELMLDCFDLNNINLFDPIEILSKLTIDELNNEVKQLNIKNSVVSVCLPKNKN